MGAWRAEQKWRPDGGMALETWCYRAMRGAIIDGQRTRTGWKRHGRVDIYTIDGRDPPADTLDDPERRAVTADSIRRLRKKLNASDRDLFDATLAGVTAREYAQRIGVTEGRVCQRVTRIRERLNRAL